MPGMDGMETAKVLRQDNEDMILIFVTEAEAYVFRHLMSEHFIIWLSHFPMRNLKRL